MGHDLFRSSVHLPGLRYLVADTAKDFAYGIDLTNKSELFPHFQLVDKNSRFQPLGEVLLSPDVSTLVSLLSVTVDPRQDLSDYRDTDVYRTATGQRVAVLDMAQVQKDEQSARNFSVAPARS